MLGAIYTGLSGLDAYQKGLQTISNNVANLNTSGFKSTSVSFTDLFSYGGGGLTFSSGPNAERSGNGVAFGGGLVDFSQGDLRASENDLDLAIQGNGFLVLLDGDQTYYARTGQFVIDKDGYVSEQANSSRHLAVLDADGRPVALNVDTLRTNPPQATDKIVFADNLSSTATDATVTDLAVYDNAGGKHIWTLKFAKKTDAGNAWTVTVTDSTGATIGTSTLKFKGSAVDPSSSKLVIKSSPAGAAPLAVTLDFSNGVTSYSAGTTSTLRAASVNGNGVGALTSVTVDETGHVKLAYSNAQTKVLGAVALADFRDPQQLQRASDGLYRDLGSGPVRLLASGIDGIGTLQSKQLEASNVDLSQEFGELILVQRGFQASSQVVSIANDMIQQLFGIRGQG